MEKDIGRAEMESEKLDCLYHEAKKEEKEKETETEEQEEEAVYYTALLCELKLFYDIYLISSANFYIQLNADKKLKESIA
jgi:hypothetical protein